MSTRGEVGGHVSPDGLTPFVGALRARVAAALAGLAPPGTTLHHHGTTVEIGLPGGPTLRAEIGLAGGDPLPRSVVAGGARLTVQPPGRTAAERAGSLGDPRYRALLGAVIPRFERAGAEIAAALAALGPYAAVDDEHYRRLARSTQGLTGMLRLGFRCNQDCGFCWQDRDWPPPPDGLYTTWVDELAAAGAERLTVSGGEPTLHPLLPDLLARAHAHGMTAQVQTNAIKLRLPAYLDRLRAAGLDAVLVSLHAADPAISDTMTRAPGTWRHTVSGIEAALGAGVMVALNAVIDARNAAHLPAYARFVVERFVAPFPTPVRVVNLSHPSPYWDGALWADTLVPFDTLAGPLGEAVTTLEAAGVSVHAAGTCGFPLCVLPAGSRAAAGMAPEAADELDTRARSYEDVCSGCDARGRCPGVRREVSARFGDRGLRSLRFSTDPPGAGRE